MNGVFCPVLLAVLKGELFWGGKWEAGEEREELSDTLDDTEGYSGLMLDGEGGFCAILS